MTTSTLSSTKIPLILRLIYIALRFPAKLMLCLTPQTVQRRWFGSDVFEKYTAYYTWITNQLGHFTVGAFLYLAAWCIAFLLPHEGTATCPAESGGGAMIGSAGVALALWLIYAIKEVADVEREQPEIERPFRLNIREVAIDGWTDSFFVAAGIVFTAGLVCIMSNIECGRGFDNPHDYILAFFIIVCIVYSLNRGWLYLPQKKRFDESFLPFYFRLTNFYNELDGFLWKPGADSGELFQDKATMLAAIEGVAGGDDSPHVCIFGPSGSGKTALAVAIACELIVGLRPLRYLSANGFNMPVQAGRKRGEPEQFDAGLLPVEDAGWIVIDHVSPSNDQPVIDEARRLTRLDRKPLFILACDHEGSERDRLVQSLGTALGAPCLAVHLGGVMPRSGSCATDVFFGRVRRAQDRRIEAEGRADAFQ